MTPIDSPIPYYPVNDFGPLTKGLVIGGVGVAAIAWIVRTVRRAAT